MARTSLWCRGLVCGWLSVVMSVAVETSTGTHHPIGEIYDETRTVVVEGRVVAFLFDDPHSLIHLRVRDRNVVRTWAVEWRSAAQLTRSGVDATAMRPGDRVVVCGHPGRDPAAFRVYLLDVMQPAPDAPAVSRQARASCSRQRETPDEPRRRLSGRR